MTASGIRESPDRWPMATTSDVAQEEEEEAEEVQPVVVLCHHFFHVAPPSYGPRRFLAPPSSSSPRRPDWRESSFLQKAHEEEEAKGWMSGEALERACRGPLQEWEGAAVREAFALSYTTDGRQVQVLRQDWEGVLSFPTSLSFPDKDVEVGPSRDRVSVLRAHCQYTSVSFQGGTPFPLSSPSSSPPPSPSWALWGPLFLRFAATVLHARAPTAASPAPPLVAGDVQRLINATRGKRSGKREAVAAPLSDVVRPPPLSSSGGVLCSPSLFLQRWARGLASLFFSSASVSMPEGTTVAGAMSTENPMSTLPSPGPLPSGVRAFRLLLTLSPSPDEGPLHMPSAKDQEGEEKKEGEKDAVVWQRAVENAVQATNAFLQSCHSICPLHPSPFAPCTALSSPFMPVVYHAPPVWSSAAIPATPLLPAWLGFDFLTAPSDRTPSLSLLRVIDMCLAMAVFLSLHAVPYTHLHLLATASSTPQRHHGTTVPIPQTDVSTTGQDLCVGAVQDGVELPTRHTRDVVADVRNWLWITRTQRLPLLHLIELPPHEGSASSSSLPTQTGERGNVTTTWQHLFCIPSIAGREDAKPTATSSLHQ